VRIRPIVITGSDTGVGKTVLTALLARHLADAGHDVAALKPVCSGGRGDARLLHAALRRKLPLDTINPWHFRAAIAPVLAARRERAALKLGAVRGHIESVSRRHVLTLVEGAGGLLSPLGEGFDTRDLIRALRATPLIVCPNRLGVVNQAALVLDALPAAARRRAVVVLMHTARCDASVQQNAELLCETCGAAVVEFPRVSHPENLTLGSRERAVRAALDWIEARVL
jgi:dethiobiotin synthetase